MRPPEVLETDRLRLRVPTLEDAPEIFLQYAQDPEVTKYLTWRPHQSIETALEFARHQTEEWQNQEGAVFPWVITLKDDDCLLGMIRLHLEGHRADLGYVLARRHWNRGFATEAVRLLVDWSLAQTDIFRVWAVCDAENAASARVLEKAGMTREGLLRRWLVLPNLGDAPRDHWCYAKVKVGSLLVAEGLDRVEPGSTVGGIDPEDRADQAGEPE